VGGRDLAGRLEGWKVEGLKVKRRRLATAVVVLIVVIDKGSSYGRVPFSFGASQSAA
jgi:hypothetical protein